MQGVAQAANGQLSRKAKVVREPKSYMDMVIPCQARERRCKDYSVRKYMTGETPAWKRHAYYIIRILYN